MKNDPEKLILVRLFYPKSLKPNLESFKSKVKHLTARLAFEDIKHKETKHKDIIKASLRTALSCY